ncbi:MAG: alpha/beta hydrolase family protein [Planctomycetaceae bacterium]
MHSTYEGQNRSESRSTTPLSDSLSITISPECEGEGHDMFRETRSTAGCFQRVCDRNLPIQWRILTALSLLLTCAATSCADESPLPKTAEKFEVDGHAAYLYAAPQPARGRPWVWYAPTLNGISLAQRKAYYEPFLRAGISLAGYDLGEVRGGPASSDQFTRFYDDMVHRGWSARPILLGQSRGGLMMLAWAMRHPDKLRAFVGIYPVCNLADWPMKDKPLLLKDYQLSEMELVERLNEFNPIEHLQGLAEQQVPMFVVHGDSDVVVPYERNTGLLKARYEALGGTITVKVIPGEGHQVLPVFFECPELVEFVLEQGRQTE